MKDFPLPAKLIAEFVGTFFLIAAGMGVFLNTASTPDLLAVAFAHGLAIAICVSAVGHVSGGHLNPAVSTALVVLGKMNPVHWLAYVIVQLLGGYCGAAAIMAATGSSGSDFVKAVPTLGDGISTMGGISLEAIGTFLLVWVVFATAVDLEGAYNKVAGLPIGLAVTTGILMIGGMTGGALNPARWFGPALLSGHWDDAIVWIVGPIVGGILAGAVHLFGVRPLLENVAASED